MYFSASNIGKQTLRENFKNDKIEILDKRKKTLIEKYGVEKYIDIPGVREKIKNKTKKNNYDKIVKINQYKPLFSKDDILKRNEFKFECVTCGNHISANENFSIKTIRCLNCFPILYNTSNMEKELADFCKQYFPNLNENDRQLIKPYELDIVIPELKLAIEFNR